MKIYVYGDVHRCHAVYRVVGIVSEKAERVEGPG